MGTYTMTVQVSLYKGKKTDAEKSLGIDIRMAVPIGKGRNSMIPLSWDMLKGRFNGKPVGKHKFGEEGEYKVTFVDKISADDVSVLKADGSFAGNHTLH